MKFTLGSCKESLEENLYEDALLCLSDMMGEGCKMAGGYLEQNSKLYVDLVICKREQQAVPIVQNCIALSVGVRKIVQFVFMSLCCDFFFDL